MQISLCCCVSHSYLQLWKLDHEKSRQEENRLIQTVMLEKAPVHFPDSKRWQASKQALEHIKPDISLGGKISTFCLTYFGHIMQSNSLEKTVMLGMVSSKRKWNCQKVQWMDAIEADTNQSLKQLKRKKKTIDQKIWREPAHRILRAGHDWMDSTVIIS